MARHPDPVELTQSQIEMHLEKVLSKISIQEDKQYGDSYCWIWDGPIGGRGYGYVWIWGTNKRVHRVAYRLFVGPVPDGLQLDHLCRNRRCLNPNHLEPVTGKENIRRGTGPTSLNARKTCCGVCGGPYVFKRHKTRGTVRECRACINAKARLYSQKKRRVM